MKNLFNKIIVAISFFCVIGFVSCNEYDYLKFDISHCGIYFTKDTLKYSFSVTPLDITEYEFKVPVKILYKAPWYTVQIGNHAEAYNDYEEVLDALIEEGIMVNTDLCESLHEVAEDFILYENMWN